ncbi:cytochrome c biogenesis protein CcsA [Chitinilyticum litopenaei]|uniref:Cytochrome c biogenesis protein CcsA n=1 Tax=Chitinilyticum piscinae TaxID=2866724 RepID=A0A8J7K195_9NEIS|nr:cytochrome c biogenesis protein CcsA [Chitinilyticum piscinae]
MTWFALIALISYSALCWRYSSALRTPAATPASKAMTLTLGLAMACHTLYQLGNFYSYPWHFGAAEALSLTGLLSILLYFSLRPILQLKGIEYPLCAFSGSALALSLLLPTGHPINPQQEWLVKLHFATAVLSQPLLINAAGIALLIKFSDRRLHHPHRLGALQNLPPVLTLERLLFLIVSITFVTLTITLGSGIAHLSQSSHSGGLLNHKVLFSLAAWLTLAALLFGHHRLGWRGRKAANLTLTGTVLLLLGYIGSRLVLEAILRR